MAVLLLGYTKAIEELANAFKVIDRQDFRDI